MELENIMLSEVSHVQKDKSHMFSLICRRQNQKINIHTKQSSSYTHLQGEHVYNSGATLWTLEGEGRERKKE
jgi:hypothetical protein